MFANDLPDRGGFVQWIVSRKTPYLKKKIHAFKHFCTCTSPVYIEYSMTTAIFTTSIGPKGFETFT